MLNENQRQRTERKPEVAIAFKCNWSPVDSLCFQCTKSEVQKHKFKELLCEKDTFKPCWTKQLENMNKALVCMAYKLETALLNFLLTGWILRYYTFFFTLFVESLPSFKTWEGPKKDTVILNLVFGKINFHVKYFVQRAVTFFPQLFNQSINAELLLISIFSKINFKHKTIILLYHIWCRNPI